jgi:membrane-associated phospholipid phosphatase
VPQPPSVDALDRPAAALLRADGTSEPDLRWVVRPWLVVAAFGAVTVVQSLRVGIPLRDPHGAILLSRIAISLGLLVGLSLLDGVVRARRSGRRTAEVLRERWTGRRLALVLAGLGAYHLVYFCYHNLKSWDVLNAPRDRDLLRWDRALFGGHDPAVLLHDLLGRHTASYVLTGWYELFGSLVLVAYVAPLVFCPRVRDGFVAIASALWVWILGTASYYAIPSLGPFDVAPQNFAGLSRTLVQDTQARYLAQRAHLLAEPHAADAFAQVSAFASLHVGITTLMLLMAHYYRQRVLTAALAVFLAGTVVATVYLGWHYALDDVAGLVIAVVGVRLGRLLVYPPWQREAGRYAGRYEPVRSTGSSTGESSAAGTPARA